MPTYFNERIFSPLERREAIALVAEIDAIFDAAIAAEAPDAEDTEGVPWDLAGLSVVGVADMREAEHEESRMADVYSDLDIKVEPEPPPSAEQARQNVVATGYAAFTLVLHPAALERLAPCRSTISLRYPGWVGQQRALEDGARADAAIAKALRRKASEVEAARAALEAIVARLDD